MIINDPRTAWGYVTTLVIIARGIQEFDQVIFRSDPGTVDPETMKMTGGWLALAAYRGYAKAQFVWDEDALAKRLKKQTDKEINSDLHAAIDEIQRLLAKLESDNAQKEKDEADRERQKIIEKMFSGKNIHDFTA